MTKQEKMRGGPDELSRYYIEPYRKRREECDICVHKLEKDLCDAKRFNEFNFIKLVGVAKRRCKDYEQKK